MRREEDTMPELLETYQNGRFAEKIPRKLPPQAGLAERLQRPAPANEQVAPTEPAPAGIRLTAQQFLAAHGVPERQRGGFLAEAKRLYPQHEGQHKATYHEWLNRYETYRQRPV
jgi:hypothetical protein